ncbi:MAG: sensor histidine kinase N-terminal domain-containing protein [Candidatus Thiodiazotropha sp. (ex Epidulcina cf. delphinae)]|nr:sensor histidine kinase N-terminal domain-containing protein [Candidatus Thiodiazotropha sp. (ex Epidulcina cf. delphinae)]
MIIRSIRFRLLLMLLLSVLLLWGTILWFTWLHTGSEINRVYDYELELVAQLLAVATEHELEEFGLDDYQADLSESGYDFPMLFQVWSQQNRLMVRGPGAPDHPLTTSIDDGYSDSEIKGEGWRVYTFNLSRHDYRIQVARAHAESRELVEAFVLDVIKPLLIALPLSGMLWFVVHQGLYPLREVTRLIAERDYEHLNPLRTERVPEEVSGLVDELNALLARLRRSIERNSRFTADVAHELRTPIAGMLVQLHSSATGRTDEEREQGIRQVKKGLDNLNHVINQLLVLASIEPEKIRSNFKKIDLEDVAQEVMVELSPEALSRKISMELRCSGTVYIDGNRQLIAIMLNNLVSNAIKFTPHEGKVAIHIVCVARGATLCVEDAGSGIPDDRKKWVFERLNRLPGKTGGGIGLGLSIVREVCELHRASITLSDHEVGDGLIVSLFIPNLRKP